MYIKTLQVGLAKNTVEEDPNIETQQTGSYIRGGRSKLGGSDYECVYIYNTCIYIHRCIDN